MPRRWHQVCGSQFRRRRWQTSPVTGESAKETVKTIAQGMPGDSGEPVVTNARVYYTPRAAAGASGARHSLRPLITEGGMFPAKLARLARRDREAVFATICCLKIESVAIHRVRTGHRRPCESIAFARTMRLVSSRLSPLNQYSGKVCGYHPPRSDGGLSGCRATGRFTLSRPNVGYPASGRSADQAQLPP